MFSATERPSTTSSSWYMVATPSFSARDRVRDRHRLAVDQDLALVGLVRSRQDLDERGLARSVLPEQAVHLAGPDVEVDTVECACAGELLDDASHREQSGLLGVGFDHVDETRRTYVDRQAKVGRCVAELCERDLHKRCPSRTRVATRTSGTGVVHCAHGRADQVRPEADGCRGDVPAPPRRDSAHARRPRHPHRPGALHDRRPSRPAARVGLHRPGGRGEAPRAAAPLPPSGSTRPRGSCSPSTSAPPTRGSR